jgi:hypothetical protein
MVEVWRAALRQERSFGSTMLFSASRTEPIVGY